MISRITEFKRKYPDSVAEDRWEGEGGHVDTSIEDSQSKEQQIKSTEKVTSHESGKRNRQ